MEGGNGTAESLEVLYGVGAQRNDSYKWNSGGECVCSLITSVYQEVKDRILPLENVTRFHNSRNIPGYNHSWYHENREPWHPKIILSLHKSCTVLQRKCSPFAHRIPGAQPDRPNGCWSHRSPTPFLPRLFSVVRVPALTTSTSVQQEVVAFLRPVLQYNKRPQMIK